MKEKSKVKEPVRIRFKKLANGNQSIYLDIYTNGARSYEFLKLYLIPEKSAAAKVANRNTMQAANAIKAERIIDIANGKAGISKPIDGASVLFIDFMREVASQKSGNLYSATIRHLIAYKGDKKTMAQIDEKFVQGFLRFLDTQKTVWGGEISNNTKAAYCKRLSVALNIAVRRGLIASNPLAKISADEKPHAKDANRAFLDVEEVKAMAAGFCRNDQVKRAFMFACFCGLRYSDIKALTWGQLNTDGQQWSADVTMQKTGDRIILPLSPEAVKWLPERGTAYDFGNVFCLPCVSVVEKILKVWAQGCGIKKRVTFHVSRHTFATLSLTAGADLYTTSKLLGHSDIKTTQIYAKIVDSKKNEAVNAISSLFQ